MYLGAAAVSPRGMPDYSKEAAVIQDLATRSAFSATGAREWQQTLSVRVQSEAAVRQFGILGFLYNSDNERIEIEYVRVKKADGSVVETPASTPWISQHRSPPWRPPTAIFGKNRFPLKGLDWGTYWILRPKLTAEARSAGPVLVPAVPVDDSVVLNQSLEIRVPKDKYVQVSSPKLKDETRDEGDRRIYVWKHSHLAPSEPEDKKKEAAVTDDRADTDHHIQELEEVGNWWGAPASEQAKVTPAIQAKPRN